jgi:hypothetical protein
MMFLLLILIVQIVAAVGLATLLCAKLRWSKSRVALLSALPIPLLLGGLAVYLAGYERLVQSVDEQPAELAITICIGVIGLFGIGFAVAAATVRRIKRSHVDPNQISDLFS